MIEHVTRAISVLVALFFAAVVANGIDKLFGRTDFSFVLAAVVGVSLAAYWIVRYCGENY